MAGRPASPHYSTRYVEAERQKSPVSGFNFGHNESLKSSDAMPRTMGTLTGDTRHEYSQ